jgi:hypothetical protein
VCAFIPITFPTTIVTCDGQNKAVPTTTPWVENTEYIIPLCGNNAGSVGWLDWYPPNGGASELADEICSPNPPVLDLPDWFKVTSTGNVNKAEVEDCLNKYAGQRILMPMFDDTCRDDPGEDLSGLPAECTSTQEPSGQLRGLRAAFSKGRLCQRQQQDGVRAGQQRRHVVPYRPLRRRRVGRDRRAVGSERAPAARAAVRGSAHQVGVGRASVRRAARTAAVSPAAGLTVTRMSLPR